MVSKNTWKEIALLLLVILAIVITLEIGAPTLIAKFWDAIRHFFGISLIIIIAMVNWREVAIVKKFRENPWKEITFLLLLLLAIVITLEIGAPTLIDKLWDAIRHLFGIPFA